MRFVSLAMLIWACAIPPAWAPLPTGETDDETGLLRAIQAQPDEDTPRLAYADWLDEHDRPLRAEFIRLQIQLARLEPANGKRSELEAREQELLKNPQATGEPKYFTDALRFPVVQLQASAQSQAVGLLEAIRKHPGEWTPRLAYADLLDEHGFPKEADAIRHQVAAGVRLKYSRGFLEGVEGSESWWGEHGKKALEESPFLRAVTTLPGAVYDASSMRQVITNLSGSDVTPQLQAIRFGGRIPTVAQMNDLLPHLGGLRSIQADQIVDADFAAAVLRSPMAAHLEQVLLQIMRESPAVREAVRRLSSRPHALRRVCSTLHRLLPDDLKATIQSESDSGCARFLNVCFNN